MGFLVHGVECSKINGIEISKVHGVTITQGGGETLSGNYGTSLTSHYSMTGDATDDAGTSNGTQNGGSFSSAQAVFGQSFLCDGINDNISGVSPIPSTGDFTLTGWFYSTGLKNGNNVLWRQSNYPTGGRMSLAVNAAKQMTVFHNGGANLTGVTTLANNTWYFFAYIRSGSTVYLFVNDKLEAIGSDSGSFSVAAPITINSPNSDGMVGYLDEYTIWQGRSLTHGTTTVGDTISGELSGVYNGGSGIPYS